MNMQGQIAVVTGATRGIGRAIGLELGRQGATVIGTATSEAGAAQIADAWKAAGVSGHGRVLNVADAAACETFWGAVQKEAGEPAILINNAGITRDTLLLRMRDEDWAAVLDTNLTSVFRLSKLAVRGMMKARYGRIVNVSSVIGSTGNAGQANYAAAKAGIAGFSKSLAREVGSRNITVNCVAPGFIETDMTKGLSEDQRKGLLGQIPLARLGAVEDIAAAVAFLASPAAGYITGATLHVNGGMFMD